MFPTDESLVPSSLKELLSPEDWNPSDLNTRDGRGSYFFHGAGRGGERQGKKSTGRGGAGNPPFPTMRGGAGKGSKSAGWGGAGAGNMLRVSAD